MSPRSAFALALASELFNAAVDVTRNASLRTGEIQEKA